MEIRSVWEENIRIYGVRKVWRQLNREQFPVARCTVERLMRIQHMQGVRRGGFCRITISDSVDIFPSDGIKRQFAASRPNQLSPMEFEKLQIGS